jgi:mono/diheme cytochrome c family protein
MMPFNRDDGLNLRFTSIFGAMLLATVALPVVAQGVGDPAEGHRIAEKWCLNCHVVAADARSGTSTGAPTFVAIAQMKSISPLSLRVFLQTPHARMPDLHLTREEIDDLTDYILSLRKN